MTIKRIDFAPNDVLTAADLEQVQDNAAVQVTSISELSSLPSTVKVAYCDEDDTIYVYRGSAWLGQGIYSDFTPSLTASTTNPTNWTATGRYTQIGKKVSGWGRFEATASYTMGSGYYVFGAPVTAASIGTFVTCGTAQLFDTYNNAIYQYNLERFSTGFVARFGNGLSGLALGDTGYNGASGTVISYSFEYEAAS